jgi:hypothetical protein
MEYIKIGITILIIIVILSLFFSLIRFFVDKYLSDFYQELFKRIRKTFILIKRLFIKK